MKSPLVLLAYSLNQTLDNFLFPAYYIHWDRNKEKWRQLERNKYLKAIPYTIVNFCIVGILMIGSLVFILLTAFFCPGSFPAEQILTLSYAGLGMNTSIGFDTIVLLYGNELVALTNWLLHLENTKIDQKQQVNFRTVTKDIVKTLRGETHWIGLLLNSVVLSYCFAAIVIPIAMVFRNWDPIFFALKAISMLLKIEDIYASTWEFVTARYVLSFLSSQAMLLNFRALSMTGYFVGVSAMALLKRLEKKPLNPFILMEYKELQIAIAVAFGLVNSLFGGVVAFGFIGQVIGLNVLIFAAEGKTNAVVVGMSSFFSAVTLFILCFSFAVGCSINERSLKIKEKWSKDLIYYRRFQGNILRRQLLGCRLLALPVGSVGILDKKVKINYFNHTLNNIVNVMLVMNEAA
ncbi:unnamed protein product [Orchesella dallaii]|uniref:Odorant receptor n=1 Tax=Orchesella dallaii TaxID=48710 RepID=A0ABP1S0U2_9HEXA